MQPSLTLNACCSVAYGHPAVRWLLGDSFHPGGLALTTRLANAMNIGESSLVLDAGSGTGASAVHLARTTGCRVTGVTLEAEGASNGREEASRHGVEDKVAFVHGDIMEVDLPPEPYDAVVMECLLSILANKPAALARLHGLLKPGGRLGITDVTVDGPLPSKLEGLLAAVGCVGRARSIQEYGRLLADQGFTVECSENCDGAASSFLGRIDRRLRMAGLASRLRLLPVSVDAIAEGRELLSSVRELVERGVLGYGLIVARKPAA